MVDNLASQWLGLLNKISLHNNSCWSGSVHRSPNNKIYFHCHAYPHGETLLLKIPYITGMWNNFVIIFSFMFECYQIIVSRIVFSFLFQIFWHTIDFNLICTSPNTSTIFTLPHVFNFRVPALFPVMLEYMLCCNVFSFSVFIPRWQCWSFPAFPSQPIAVSQWPTWGGSHKKNSVQARQWFK